VRTNIAGSAYEPPTCITYTAMWYSISQCGMVKAQAHNPIANVGISLRAQHPVCGAREARPNNPTASVGIDQRAS
jgi:hypothetical protein